MSRFCKEIKLFKFFSKEIQYLFTKNGGFCSRFGGATIISKVNLIFLDEDFRKRILLISPDFMDRFGRLLVVSSRKNGTAVKRNLIKRRIKQIFREEKLYGLAVSSIIFPSSKLVEMEYDLLKKELVEHFYLAKNYFTAKVF